MVLRLAGQVTVEIATSTIGSVTVTEEDGALGGVDTIVITSSELEINLQTVDADVDTLAVPADQKLSSGSRAAPATERSIFRARRWVTTTPSRSRHQ